MLAFGITTCVLVPAALHHLTAGAKQVAKLAAPSSRTLEIDGMKVEVSADKAIVDPGDKVRVKLRGAVPAGKRVTMELMVMESIGSDGGRVDNPPRTLERASVTLVGSAKGADQEVAFTLPGRRGTGMGGISTYGHYEILVVSPRTADQLEKLVRKARKAGDPMMGDGTAYSDWGTAYREIDASAETDEDGVSAKPGKSARLTVQTRAKDSPIAIAMPGKLVVGEEGVVKVTVTNPTRRKLTTAVTLNAPPTLHGEYLGIPAEEIEMPDEITVELPPWGKREVTFKVTANQAGTLGLYARATCSGDNGDDSWRACQRVEDGALEAIEVSAPVEKTPAAKVAKVAKK